MNATTYGLDVAKRVFQMYWVDAQTGEIVNRRFGRDQLIGFLAQRSAGRVALEACGSGHWWARKIKTLGHEVVLLHAKFIRPFVQTNKTDAAHARAIWTAMQQPAMRTVAAKTEDQQAMLSLHRIRCITGQVPDHAGEPVTRVVVRVWRDVSGRSPGWAGGDPSAHGGAGGYAAGSDDLQFAGPVETHRWAWARYRPA
jgi:hypothetical protein